MTARRARPPPSLFGLNDVTSVSSSAAEIIPGQTCINLRVGGKVVRTATGKNREALEPRSWDVADLEEPGSGDRDRRSAFSGGWGHVNVDQIVFTDVPPEPFLKRGTSFEAAAKALNLVRSRPKM